MEENNGKYRYDADLLDYVNQIYATYPGERVFDQYLLSLKTEGNVSERTISLYIKDLFGTYDQKNKITRSAEYTFFTFLCLQNVTSHDQVNRELIREYKIWLVTHNIANTSVNRRLCSLRSFYKYLLIEEKVKNSPIPIRTHQRNSPSSTLSMKIDKRLPVFLTQQEMELLLHTPDASKPEGQRDRTILELFYAAGLRVSEITGIDIKDINLDAREISVVGKGSKERIVLIGVPAVDALKEYLGHSRPQLLNGKRSEALFVSKYGARLIDRRMQKILKKYTRLIGLDKNVHPHVLRHTFATHMLDGGADLRVVQELLGHADLSSTQIYTHVTQQQARKVYLTAHPMAQDKDISNGHPE